MPEHARALRRVAVIGDIHAEDALLETALDSISSHLSVDAIVCTGDVVDGRGSVGRCCDLLRQHNVLCVRGNHDRWLFTGLLRDCAGATRLEDLSEVDREFLRTLPSTRELAIPGGSMLVCHGIGDSDLEKITDFDTDYSLKMKRCLQEVVAAGKYGLMVNGHSHQRFVRDVGGLLVVNAGALCHPEDPGFVLLDFEQDLFQWHALRSATALVSEEQPLVVARR